MGRTNELVAWILSLALLALASGALGSPSLEGASLLGAAALPWVALAGLPRGPEHRGARAGARDGALTACAGAVPLLFLAAGLEVAAGERTEDVILRSLQLLLVIGGLSHAAAAARERGATARALHAGLWLLLLPLAAALAVALGWAATTAPAAEAGQGLGWAALERWSPLFWVHAEAAGRGREGWALGALGATALLVLLARAARARPSSLDEVSAEERA